MKQLHDTAHSGDTPGARRMSIRVRSPRSVQSSLTVLLTTGSIQPDEHLGDLAVLADQLHLHPVDRIRGTRRLVQCLLGVVAAERPG